MNEDAKKPEDQAPQPPAAEQTKPVEPPKPRGRSRAAKKPEHGIKNARSGDVNLGGMLFIKPGDVVELTAEQKKNARLMAKVKRGLETGLLKEV